MLVSEFDYHLPEELIAQEPLASREAARMLHLERGGGTVTDRQFSELPDLLRSGDLVVLNNTRVFPARLFARRGGRNSQPLSPRNPASKDFLRGEVEVLLTRQLAENDWEALVRPGRRIGVGERLYFPPPASLGKREAEAPQEESLRAEVVGRGEYGQRTLRFQPVEDFFGVLERIGHIPLPPYIRRPDRAADRDRYQTVFGSRRGSVAAPTAGLHFTPEILRALKKRGIETAEITLHVGLGTFSPVRVAEVGDHKLHPERFAIPEDAAASINLAIAAGRRVVAVGTTTVRALEFAAQRTRNLSHAGGVIQPQQGEADIFIFPGFGFQVIGALLTNFHLPKSSLLMLVSAFGGTEFILKAYRHAVEQRYRFYSYGDCMLIE